MTKIALSIPSFILGVVIHIVSYSNMNLGIAVKAMGMKKNVMGHFVLTNIGTLGMQQGFAPLCPPCRVMGYTCMGASDKKPAAVGDKIEIQDMVTLSNTIDYRLLNPEIFSRFSKTMCGYIEDPASMQK